MGWICSPTETGQPGDDNIAIALGDESLAAPTNGDGNTAIASADACIAIAGGDSGQTATC